jgi:hypothetical protein
MLAMWDVTGKPEYKEHAEKWFTLLKSRMKPETNGTYEIWNYWQPAGPWDYKPDHTTKHWVGVHPNNGYYEADSAGVVAAYEHGLVFTKADIDRLIATAKSSWTSSEGLGVVQEYFNPSNLVPGMEISFAPASGTAKEINACFPNSKTAKPISAGAGAVTGTVVSVQWNRQTKKGSVVFRRAGAQADVTINVDQNTKMQLLRMWSALAPYDVEIQKQFEATMNPGGWGGLGGAPSYLMLQAKIGGK